MSSQAEAGSGTEAPGFEDVLWQVADRLRSSTDISEYKDLVFRLIFLKYVADAFKERRETLRGKLAEDEITGELADDDRESPGKCAAAGTFWVPPEARWDYLRKLATHPQIGTLIDNAMDLIVVDPGLSGTLPKTQSGSRLDTRMVGELIDLISGVNLVAALRSDKDFDESVTGYLMRLFTSKDTDAGAFYTPRSVVRQFVEMVKPYSGRVYDPCCGSGGMFIQAERLVTPHGTSAGHVTVYGQETAHTPRLLAKMNMLLHGIEANLGKQSGDSLREDMHRDLEADYVLANPPFNISGWGNDQLRDDARWRYGVPPADNANFAWLQHIMSHLSPDGVAAVVMPNGAASSQRRSEAEIRRRMIEADLIECIVALPEQLFCSTQIPVIIWILKRGEAPDGARHGCDRRGETLFIDARNLGVMVDRTHRRLTGKDIAYIIATYHAWRGEPSEGSYLDSPGFCVSATTREIAEHRYVLTPSRYVGAGGGRWPDEGVSRVTEELRAAGWRVSRLGDLVKHADYLRSEKAPERAAKVAELRDEERLVLPIEAHFDAAYGAVPEAVVPNRCLLLSLMSEINGMFLAAWLNSDDGRRARVDAIPGTGRSPRTLSLASLRCFLDGLMVPIPSPDSGD